MTIFRDKQLAVCVLAAPVFWAGLMWWSPGSFDAAWPVRAPLLFLTPAIVYPLLEEIVFRGALQPFLLRYEPCRKQWRGLSLANVLTSLIFTAAHLISHSPLWAAATYPPSLIFGYFRDRDDSLKIPIALHIFYNVGYFWLFGGVST